MLSQLSLQRLQSLRMQRAGGGALGDRNLPFRIGQPKFGERLLCWLLAAAWLCSRGQLGCLRIAIRRLVVNVVPFLRVPERQKVQPSAIACMQQAAS